MVTSLVETSMPSYIGQVVRLSLGIVFLLAVLPKLRQPRVFARTVIEYDILPTRIAYISGLSLVPVEAFLAVSFITGWKDGIAQPIAVVLLLLFSFAVGINLKRGRKINCGCFGTASEQISHRTLSRLLMLLAAVMLLAALSRIADGALPGSASLIASAGPSAYVLETAWLASALVLLGAWALSLPELASLFRFPNSQVPRT